MPHITVALSPISEARLRRLAEERDERFETVAADALSLGLSAHFLGRAIAQDPAHCPTVAVCEIATSSLEPRT